MAPAAEAPCPARSSVQLGDAAAAEAAAAIEKKAYTAASVAARTTTGDRPAAEITSGYIR
jgi:hypothetical protein